MSKNPVVLRSLLLRIGKQLLRDIGEIEVYGRYSHEMHGLCDMIAAVSRNGHASEYIMLMRMLSEYRPPMIEPSRYWWPFDTRAGKLRRLAVVHDMIRRLAV